VPILLGIMVGQKEKLNVGGTFCLVFIVYALYIVVHCRLHSKVLFVENV